MSGYEKIGVLVREERRKIHPNAKDAAPLIGIGMKKLWEIENGMAYLSPELVHQLSTALNNPEIASIYGRECCPLGCQNCTPKSMDFAVSVIALQQCYKELGNVVLEVLPDAAKNGKIDDHEIQDLLECKEKLKELKFNIDCLILRIEQETKEKTASGKAA